MLRVSRQISGEPEVFYSLQGEGPTLGTPSVFLRLATCNLACRWCDTKYTWDWANHDYNREVISMDWRQVEERLLGYPCRNMVITGGEPLLQQEALAPLVGSVKRAGFRVEVETNGTIAPSPEMAEAIDQWNVSPKLSNSGNFKDRREVPGVLEAFRLLPGAYFKFVVVTPSDVDEVCALRDNYGLPPQRIILMPEGQNPDALRDRSQWLSEACIKEGFRFSTRLHILLWGDERGR